MYKYFGLSGQNEKVNNCNAAGKAGKLKSKGQNFSVPRTKSIPIICDNNTPKTMANWLSVPAAPRNLKGAISDRYRGATPVLIPVKDDN